MKRSSRSKIAALSVFLLMAAVQIGSIIWATFATVELAKKNIQDERNARLRAAISRMDNFVAGVLYPEASRQYHDYIALHAIDAVAARSRDGVELDADFVLVRSPLASSPPPADWIDVYFHIDPDGVPSSPQVDAGADCEPRACRTWNWFVDVLPRLNMGDRVAQGIIADPDLADLPARAIAALRKSFRDRQRAYLPAQQCIPEHIVARNFRQGTDRQALYEQVSRLADIEVKTGEFITPFWIEPDAPDGRKLCFARPTYVDDSVAYQGFIADWTRLEAALRARVVDLFPEADLQASMEDTSSESKLASLPVKLVVPEMPGGVAGAAWKSVRGTLLAMWAAALAVLTIAGIGLRNLVALTERRMQFAYAVTHELRTPLTTFRLYTDMLAAGLVPEESKADYLNTLHREAFRLSTLVEDVLEYSRLENQRVRLSLVDTDGTALMEKLADSIRRRCLDNGVEPRLENTLPKEERIYTDVDVVNRIASVLVNNAVRHARGGKHPSVVLRLEAENGKMHMDVIDTGPGVDLADARVIFKPFRRGRKADARAHGGIGLGLSLARNWAGLLGGRLDLVARHHPQYGGAHFRLTIPREMQEPRN